MKRRHLRVIRAERDVTQSAVARLSGFSLTRYWKIENGELPEPSDWEKRAIAAALEVKVSEVAWPAYAHAKVGAEHAS